MLVYFYTEGDHTLVEIYASFIYASYIIHMYINIYKIWTYGYVYIYIMVYIYTCILGA